MVEAGGAPQPVVVDASASPDRSGKLMVTEMSSEDAKADVDNLDDFEREINELLKPETNREADSLFAKSDAKSDKSNKYRDYNSE